FGGFEYVIVIGKSVLTTRFFLEMIRQELFSFNYLSGDTQEMVIHQFDLFISTCLVLLKQG
ncbi:MAG: hypothetical protein LIO97_05085, partial [Tannerellaceae bacterium]|nr:hypothetical protein [Tannerellaceae bacterium]